MPFSFGARSFFCFFPGGSFPLSGMVGLDVGCGFGEGDWPPVVLVSATAGEGVAAACSALASVPPRAGAAEEALDFGRGILLADDLGEAAKTLPRTTLLGRVADLCQVGYLLHMYSLRLGGPTCRNVKLSLRAVQVPG